MLDHYKQIKSFELQKPPFVEEVSLTEKMASRFGVAKEQFQNWRWQMSQQIRSYKEASSYLELQPKEVLGFSSGRGFCLKKNLTTPSRSTGGGRIVCL